MATSIGYFGSPEFSAQLLERIILAGVNVDFVVTNIDKPVGRKKELSPTPVKRMALKYKIPVLQSEKLRLDLEVQKQINSFPSSIHVVFAYGSIIPEINFLHPIFKSINLHGSLLPKFRGASPVQSFLLSGEKKTGYSIQYLAKEVDSGDIICSEEWESSIDDTTESLLLEITERGGKRLIELLMDLDTVPLKAEPQDPMFATHCKKIVSEDRPIHWEQSAFQIHNQIRALYPDPLAYTSFREKRIIILKSIYIPEELNQRSDLPPGSFFLEGKKRLFCVCGDGNLIGIEILQPEGKKPMNGSDFFNGARLLAAEKFL